MIYANELRVNNLILNSKGVVIPVRNINNNGRVNMGFTQSYLLYACNGIPLTDDWLFRCKFKDDGPWALSYNSLEFRYDDEKRLHMAWGRGPFSVVGRNIKFVHQLQNIYYVLTGGEELVFIKMEDDKN